MWRKDESNPTPQASNPRSEPQPDRSRAVGNAAVIGSGITVDGTISGDQDLLVEGKVLGTIKLDGNTVTIGGDGVVAASVHARVIIVHGSVEGDLNGGEQIEVRASGDVTGNIVAPRVGLEDGSRFKGNIDMDTAAPSAPQPSLIDDAADDDDDDDEDLDGPPSFAS